MVEIEHNGHRYMVDGGQWFREIDFEDVITANCQQRFNREDEEGWPMRGDWTVVPEFDVGKTVSKADPGWFDYRVPYPDPRPPFVVGQRVRVARKSGDDYLDQLVEQCGTVTGVVLGDNVDCDFEQVKVYVSIPPWCLDAVHASPADELTAQAQELGMYEDTYTSVPLEKVGEIKVKFQEAVPLPPRTIEPKYVIAWRSANGFAELDETVSKKSIRAADAAAEKLKSR